MRSDELERMGGFDPDFLAWAKGQPDRATAWAASTDGAQMLRYCQLVGVPQKLVALAAAKCAALVEHADPSAKAQDAAILAKLRDYGEDKAPLADAKAFKVQAEITPAVIALKSADEDGSYLAAGASVAHMVRLAIAQGASEKQAADLLALAADTVRAVIPFKVVDAAAG